MIEKIGVFVGVWLILVNIIGQVIVGRQVAVKSIHRLIVWGRRFVSNFLDEVSSCFGNHVYKVVAIGRWRAVVAVEAFFVPFK